ncbi:hypothetical protein PFISCL1PPCAC_2413, partial [Pristionchus fissidentatus]
LDVELNRPEPFTQRDVDLRVQKARMLRDTFQQFSSRIGTLKESVEDTIAKELDRFLTQLDQIGKIDRKRREESKKLKSLKKDEETNAANVTPVICQKRMMAEIKQEPLDYEMFAINQITLRD